MGRPQLNIKDAETSAMVRELAELTGESQTETIRRAVKERLVRTKSRRNSSTGGRMARKRQFERTVANIRKIQAEVRRRIKPGDFLTDADLYDDKGLPK